MPPFAGAAVKWPCVWIKCGNISEAWYKQEGIFSAVILVQNSSLLVFMGWVSQTEGARGKICLITVYLPGRSHLIKSNVQANSNGFSFASLCLRLCFHTQSKVVQR